MWYQNASTYNVLFSSCFEGQIWQRINLKYNDFVSPRSGICHIKFLQFFLTYLRVPFICKMIIKILHENTRFLLNTQKQKETHRTNLPEKPLKTISQKIFVLKLNEKKYGSSYRWKGVVLCYFLIHVKLI